MQWFWTIGAFAAVVVFQSVDAARPNPPQRSAWNADFVEFNRHIAEARKAGQLHEPEGDSGHVLDVLHEDFSFEKSALPGLVDAKIGVLGMKAFDQGRLTRRVKMSPEACLRYNLTLPVSTQIVGFEKPEEVAENATIARAFRPLTEDELADILAEAKQRMAHAGNLEIYKNNWAHGTTTRRQEG